MIKVATVCSGIGSPEQALANIGVEHEISFSCEIDKYPRASYAANFKAKHTYTDMTKEAWDLPEQYSDLFVGGIPCQSFSLAGKRLGELDPRGLLFFDFYRYVKNQQPKVFIIENVKGLLSDNKGKTFQNWLLLLGRSVNQHEQMFMHPDSLEYNLHHTVLNSKNFGVPQNRERVFIVGIRKDLPNDFSFPKGWALDKRLKDVLEPAVHEKYYLSDKMINCLVRHSDKNINNVGRMPNFLNGDDLTSTIKANYGKMPGDGDYLNVNKSGYISQNTQGSAVYSIYSVSPTVCAGTHGYANGYIEVKEATKKGFSIAEAGDSINFSHPDSKTRKGRVGKQIANTIDTGSNQCVMEPKLVLEYNLPGIHESSNRVYSSEGISPTVTAKQGGGHEPKTTQHNRIRRLTPLECWRLQGFSDQSFWNAKKNSVFKEKGKPDKWGMSDTQLYKQAGNSITVYKIQAVIQKLLHLL